MSSAPTSHLHKIGHLLGEVLSFQVRQLAALYGGVSRWNAFTVAQSEHVAEGMHQLTKEHLRYLGELGADLHESRRAVAKKSRAVWGMFA